MTKRIRRLLTPLLIVLCLSMTMTLVSCGAGEGDTDTEASSLTGEAETRLAAPDVSAVDLQGKKFTVLYRLGADSYNQRDIDTEKLNGESINDAVFTRNRMLQDDLGVELICTPEVTPSDVLRRLGLSGDAEYDAVTERMITTFPMTMENYFHNWKKLSYYDPDDPWWDANAAEALSIGGTQYIAVGNMSMGASSCARFLFFNKGICENYNLALPYDLVRNGKWTMDEYISMVGSVAEDLNGDGKMTGDDRFGLLSETSTFYIVGCEVPFTTKDESGYPVISFMTDRTVEVVEKVLELAKDTTHTCSFSKAAEGKDTSGFNHIFDYGRNLFAEDHFLFVQNGPTESNQFVDMKSAYGVLPNPKYDELQKSYHHLVDPFAAAWVIPSTVTDLDRVDACLTYWAYASTDTLVVAFYENTIKNKRLDAPDDAEMLDIFMDSLCYEITTIADLPITSILTGASSGSGLMSSYKKQETKLNKQLEKIIKKYASAE